ncbi:MAG: hypothetical protein MJY56_07675 [Bacteroidales bacterium]|nr:hypothetical protein [Bacteroidales bacterium]
MKRNILIVTALAWGAIVFSGCADKVESWENFTSDGYEVKFYADGAEIQYVDGTPVEIDRHKTLSLGVFIDGEEIPCNSQSVIWSRGRTDFIFAKGNVSDPKVAGTDYTDFWTYDEKTYGPTRHFHYAVNTTNYGKVKVEIEFFSSEAPSVCVARRVFTLVVCPECVDLGLRVKWCKYNLGASSLDKAGGYYYWGSENCNAENDPARKAGNGCGMRMPTRAEFTELINNTTVTVGNIDGVRGATILTSKKPGYTDKYIVFCAHGIQYDSHISQSDYDSGFFMSSTPSASNPEDIVCLKTFGKSLQMYAVSKFKGVNIRPVIEK